MRRIGESERLAWKNHQAEIKRQLEETNRLAEQLRALSNVQIRSAALESTVTGTAGRGAVVVELTGTGVVKDLRIRKDALAPENVGALRDLVRLALSDALYLRRKRNLEVERLLEPDTSKVSSDDVEARSADLGSRTVEGTAGDGAVVIVMKGDASEVTDAQIRQEVIDPENVDTLQDLVGVAFTDALTKQGRLQRSLGRLLRHVIADRPRGT